MKKTLFIICLSVAGLQISLAQQKYFSKTGNISFFGATAMENIDGRSATAVSVIDAGSGALEFAVLNKSFQFQRELMQEHFNENYMESDKYPKSTFKGTVQNIKEVNFTKDGEYPVTVSGSLTIHGVSKDVVVLGKIVVSNGIVFSKATFDVACADYNIQIPSVVADKISKSMKITVDIKYNPYSATGTN